MRRIALAIGLILSHPAAAASAVDPPPGEYRYAVLHPVFGKIGTFTNAVTRAGNVTTVKTTVRIDAKLLFISLHRTTADRLEVWQGGRLVRFSGMTLDNSKTMRLTGHAAGDGFLIEGPNGKTSAPADVFPANPWSIRFTKSTTLMNTEDGRIIRVTIRREPDQPISVKGRTVETQHFTVSGGGTGEVWYDQNNVPVQFTYLTHDTNISFVLQ